MPNTYPDGASQVDFTQFPILDLRQPFIFTRGAGRRHPVWDRILLILAAFVILGAATAFAILLFMKPEALYPLVPFANLLKPLARTLDAINGVLGPFGALLPLLAGACALLIHEVAHALVAWMTGMEVREITVGPFILVVAKPWRLRFRTKGRNSGEVRYSAPCRPRLRRKLIFVSAAGPGANLVVGTVCLLAAAHGPARMTFADALLITFGVFSFLIGIPTLIPSGGSDGGKLMLLATRDGTAQYLALLAIERNLRRRGLFEGIRKTWIQRAASCERDPRIAFSGCYCAAMMAGQREDRVEAARQVERCLSLVKYVGASQRNEVVALASMQQGLYGSVEKARIWRERVKTPPGLPPIRQAGVDGVIATMEGDTAAARKHWASGQESLEKLPPSAQKDEAIFHWQKWEKDMEDRLQRTATTEPS